MGTLKGFPNPPALWLRRASPASPTRFDGNPERVPKPSRALLRRAKPGFACRDLMGTLKAAYSAFLAIPPSAAGSGNRLLPRTWEYFLGPTGCMPREPLPPPRGAAGFGGVARRMRPLHEAGGQGRARAFGPAHAGCWRAGSRLHREHRQRLRPSAQVPVSIARRSHGRADDGRSRDAPSMSAPQEPAWRAPRSASTLGGGAGHGIDRLARGYWSTSFTSTTGRSSTSRTSTSPPERSSCSSASASHRPWRLPHRRRRCESSFAMVALAPAGAVGDSGRDSGLPSLLFQQPFALLRHRGASSPGACAWPPSGSRPREPPVE